MRSTFVGSFLLGIGTIGMIDGIFFIKYCNGIVLICTLTVSIK